MSKPHKTSEILKKSLKYLRDGKNNRSGRTNYFVCHAIEETDLDGYESVIKMIAKRLGCSKLVQSRGIEGWLEKQGIDTDTHLPEVIQDYRKRWVLSMIAEFEAKGD
jgi:hypothetical protein